jgi:hypothetical protein
MESTVRKVGDSPAKKVIPESSIMDSDTKTIEAGAEKVILESPFEESDSKYDHIEKEFKVLKGSIKKLIVDIREQMNASENPFLNIQQMMPAQSSIFRDDPLDADRPAKKIERETQADEAEISAPKKNDINSPPAPDINNNCANDHCPLAARQGRAVTRCAALGAEQSGRGDTCPVMKRLYGSRDYSTGELCYECIRSGHLPERNATSQVRQGCPAGFCDTAPWGRSADQGHGAWYQGRPLPCMPQHAASRQGKPGYGPYDGPFMQDPCSRCPQKGKPHMYGPGPSDNGYYPFHEPCRGDYSPYYRQGYAGNGRYRPGPEERRGCDGSYGYDWEPARNTSYPEGVSEQGRDRPGEWQQPRRAYRPAENTPDYYDEGPEHDYRGLQGQARPVRSQGKCRRKSLDHVSDNSYIQPEPEPEPVVIDIQSPGSVRKKHKARTRSVPDIVVVDVEPENVVPQSVRASRRKGL